MARHAVGRWIATALVVLTASLLVPGSAPAEVTVKGDRAAWAEIGAAYKKLNSLSGYRMKISGGPGAQEVIVEVAPPGATHTMVHMGSGTMEIVSVNGQTRFRMNIPGAPSGWQCRSAVPPIQTPRDPTSAQGAVEVSRGPDAAIEGTPVHTYIYTSTVGAQGQDAAAKTTLYVGTQTGLPRRAVTGTAAGESTVDYYDYGAKIEITLPPCG
jgi:hypothetical protein